jgi:hypothetical protein
VIGEYAQDAGVLDLAEQIWSELLHLEPAAWMLVLRPYVVNQLTRLAIRLWRLKSL